MPPTSEICCEDYINTGNNNSTFCMPGILLNVLSFTESLQQLSGVS